MWKLSSLAQLMCLFTLGPMQLATTATDVSHLSPGCTLNGDPPEIKQNGTITRNLFSPA
jgi:hypothetical protein